MPFVSIFNKVKGGDNCCGSSLHKPLVFPSVPLHFPYSGLWELLLCSLYNLAICFLRKLSYFCKFTLINLTCSNISLEPFRKPCCLFNMQLELGPSFTRCSSASPRTAGPRRTPSPPSGIKMINRRGSRTVRDMEMWGRLLYRGAFPLGSHPENSSLIFSLPTMALYASGSGVSVAFPVWTRSFKTSNRGNTVPRGLRSKSCV